MAKTVIIDNSLDGAITDHIYRLNKRQRKKGTKRLSFCAWGREAFKEQMKREQAT